jgi:hypothetical protein
MLRPYRLLGYRLDFSNILLLNILSGTTLGNSNTTLKYFNTTLRNPNATLRNPNATLRNPNATLNYSNTAWENFNTTLGYSSDAAARNPLKTTGTYILVTMLQLGNTMEEAPAFPPIGSYRVHTSYALTSKFCISPPNPPRWGTSEPCAVGISSGSKFPRMGNLGG